ncbi:MAG: hypothetical protein ACOCZL_01060 [Bacteroidota bacterium]
MKRYIGIVTGLLFLSTGFIKAQNEVDALRYSQNFHVGTARSLGLGGAIGAVGGDFTSLSVNPAGIGLYRGSEMTFSPALYWNNSTSDFLDNNYTEEKYNVNLGNFGFVFNNKTGKEKGWIGTNFGFGYNRLNNFHREVFMRGIQNNSSYLDNFVYYADDLPSEDLDPFYEQLAWDTYMIDWDENNNEYFNDFADAGYGQVQERTLKSKGSLGEYLLSFGANYNHRLYLGATVGINRVNFEQTVIHFEDDPLDEINFTQNFRFEEYLSTRGTGYNLKLGAIVRPANFLRLGASFHLPTFYYLKDEFENTMEAYIDNENLNPEEGIENPMIASSGLGDYRYRLRTPAKAIGSAVVNFGNVGLFSVDYEFVNYQNADLSASDYNFRTENDDIENIYKAAHNLRFGGELRFGPLYFRGGYAFYDSPFATEQSNINSNRNIISAGMGIRNQFFFMDAGFRHSRQQEPYYLYVPGIVDPAVNTSNANTVQVTFGFRF